MCFAWAELFAVAGSGAEGKGKSDAEDSRLPLTHLRAACLNLLESVRGAPQTATSDETVGGEDCCDMAASGADGDEDVERTTTINKLNRM